MHETLHQQGTLLKTWTQLGAASTLSLACFSLWGEQVKAPALNEILQRLEVNLRRYDSTIPSFYSDEHVVSQVSPGNSHLDTVTDSVFRLKRVVHSDHTSTLEESREVKTVNGHTASTMELVGPTVVNGAFEGGLALVSVSQSGCNKYALDRPGREDSAAPYIVRFASVLTSRDSAGCLLDEPGKGRAFIDPATMQIIHMELNTPRHTILAGDTWSAPVTCRRTLTVDYGLVELAGRTFWMPSVITSRCTSGAGTYHETTWTFKASYGNFHKLEVTSRLVPATDGPRR